VRLDFKTRVQLSGRPRSHFAPNRYLLTFLRGLPRRRLSGGGHRHAGTMLAARELICFSIIGLEARQRTRSESQTATCRRQRSAQ
jgi:hypothetical protein